MSTSHGRALLLVICLLGAAACSSSDDAGGDTVAGTAGDTSVVESTVEATTAPTAPETTAAVTTTSAAPTTVAETTTTVAPVDIATFGWSLLADGAPWGGRAGLRVVELSDRARIQPSATAVDGTLFVIAGRTPRDSPIPGDSDLWGDVWQSDDGGVSWQRVVESGAAFPPRAYFQAVTLDDAIYVLGGQNFDFPNSTFFNDVWKSTDGTNWEQVIAAAPWVGRAGLMSAVLDGAIYVFGGSINDDSAVIGPTGPARQYLNDVWRSTDGENWEQVSAAAPWAPRAGGAAVVKDGRLYLLGGEAGFLCAPFPGCDLPYFNDVWSTTDGTNWEQVTEAAGWSARPGHSCELLADQIVCFGGFRPDGNPVDMWVSETGVDWTLLDATPWNATTPEQARYDFDSISTTLADGSEAILTVGGDRETFSFGDPENWKRIDDDVWLFSETPEP